MITSRNKGKWIIPKGVIEPCMTPQGSALQEAFEEAGVDGDVDEIPIGKFEVEKKWGGNLHNHCLFDEGD